MTAKEAKMLLTESSDVTLVTELLYEAPDIFGLEYHRFFATVGELPTIYFRETTSVDEAITTFGPYDSLVDAARGLLLSE